MMNKHGRLFWLAPLALGFASLSVGCKGEPKLEPKHEATSMETKEREAAEAIEAALVKLKSPLREIMTAYERCRVLLADDRSEGLKTCASSMSAMAQKSSTDKPSELLLALGEASVLLAAKSGGDLPAARLAFGEVSRALVGWTRAEDVLGEPLHLFECPMAKGFKQWVQLDSKISNPYMGKSMLECGFEVEAESEVSVD